MERYPIALVLSDVDGTLVTNDKQLTSATRAAVRRLGEAGIGFTITSSRPHFGLKATVEALDLKLPVGAFNGGVIAGPDLKVIEEHLIPEAAARRSVELLAAAGISAWLFSGERWLVLDPAGDYVERETHTIATSPTVVADFGEALGHAIKIVGASRDFDHLAECEERLKAEIGAGAEVARSQRYYLDVTPPGVDKGTVLDALSRRLGIPTRQICVIGDMDNDVAMLRKGGLAIAMGNGSAAAKQAATLVTRSNEEDGFAYAVDRFILGTD